MEVFENEFDPYTAWRTKMFLFAQFLCDSIPSSYCHKETRLRVTRYSVKQGRIATLLGTSFCLTGAVDSHFPVVQECDGIPVFDCLQRCKEKLNTLAISVMNQWPGVKLRVTEGWDEEGHHATDSLHYEGRAVDVTTSDRDRSKYGMLARLAVEAGFDWVYYESRAHIHCSVKSESSQAAKSGGCFTGETTTETSDGRTVKLADVRVGDHILSLDRATGRLSYSEVILFLDRDPEQRREFLRITTTSGRSLTVTPSHLLMIANKRNTSVIAHELNTKTIFADQVKVGDYILVHGHDRLSSTGLDKVQEVLPVLRRGVYAPLTREGTVVVNGVVASCYAVVNNPSLAHLALAPVRIYANLRDGVLRVLLALSRPLSGRPNRQPARPDTVPVGVHWYANMLYTFSRYVLPAQMLYR
uniref:Hedgehog protein n=1 Tax=Timema douglasi TaxID=61478 RepID=A0A7R8VLJ3_TIMDO|nr:unnamed protein product [Timema douglasi]